MNNLIIDSEAIFKPAILPLSQWLAKVGLIAISIVRQHHFLKCFLVIFLFNLLSSFSQVKEEKPFLKYASWAILQAIPSPTYFEDRNASDSRLKFGFEWQVIPFSFSFNTNKYLSKVNFFYIKPSKRFSGSAECFFEPSLVLGGFEYSGLERFMFKTGARIVLPVAQKGEYFAISLGAGYYRQTGLNEKIYDGITYEAAVFSFFGMLGLKFNYNQNAVSRYNIGLYIKYY